MKEISFTPGEPIYNRSDLEDDPVLYILRKGEVELFVETPKFLDPITVTKTLKQNEIFGEISFFGGGERQTSARSSSFCNLFLIRLSDFLSVVKCNRDDYQNFCQLKDKINIYGKRENLFSKCTGCGDRNHSTVECQALHLVLSKDRYFFRIYLVFRKSSNIINNNKNETHLPHHKPLPCLKLKSIITTEIRISSYYFQIK